MSRATKKPITIPAGVEVNINGSEINVKGTKGVMQLHSQDMVGVKKENDEIVFMPKEEIENSTAMTGTIRALVKNMVTGVTEGFERKLILVGVGFKAQAQGKILNLSLGFSHPVKFPIPTGITIEIPSQTEIVIKGIDRQLVGQVAAKIRAFRPPEPYKGKGVKYDGEVIVRKEGKKK
jgi:large subunit ribosomal protein L6